MAATPIQGRVATILNERELAINIGSKDGVKHGMKFKVLANVPIEIKDPETHETLGSVDREKLRVQVVEVQAKFAVCKTFTMAMRRGGALAVSRLVPSVKDLTAEPMLVPETLRIDEGDRLPPLPESESYVKRGDRVFQVEDD